MPQPRCFATEMSDTVAFQLDLPPLNFPDETENGRHFFTNVRNPMPGWRTRPGNAKNLEDLADTVEKLKTAVANLQATVEKWETLFVSMEERLVGVCGRLGVTTDELDKLDPPK